MPAVDEGTADTLQEQTASSGEDHRHRLVDRLTLVAAVIEPLFLYPQAMEILIHRNATAVYVPTWLGINLLTGIWIWYAMVHKQHLVLLYQVLYLIANTLIIIGALTYGGRWT
jgi:uncharacterized protein with PQ loop repeat